MKTIISALKTVLGTRFYQWLTGGSFIVFLGLFLHFLIAVGRPRREQGS